MLSTSQNLIGPNSILSYGNFRSTRTRTSSGEYTANSQNWNGLTERSTVHSSTPCGSAVVQGT